MDLELLPTLVAVADTGGLTAAGRRLGLSQPAVHQQLARLADQVGRPLYRREGRGLVLTEAGERLAALGRRILVDRDATLARLRGEETLPVLCAGRGAWLHLIRTMPACRPMVADGPGTLTAVRDGRATLGIVAGPVPDDLASAVLREVGTWVVAPELPADVTWPLLRDRRWVLPPRGRPLRELVEARVGVASVVEAEGWDLQLRLVQLGCGWTLVNGLIPVPDGLASAVLPGVPPVTYRAVWHPSVQAAALLGELTWTN